MNFTIANKYGIQTYATDKNQKMAHDGLDPFQII